MIRYPYAGAGLAAFRQTGAKYPTEFHLSLFRAMLRIRLIEEAIEGRYHEDQMKTPIHLVIGQEATSVGCCAALSTVRLRSKMTPTPRWSPMCSTPSVR